MNDTFEGQQPHARRDGEGRRLRAPLWTHWIAASLVVIVTLAASIAWYRQADIQRIQQERAQLDAAAVHIAGQIHSQLTDMRLRVALIDSANNDGSGVVAAHVPLDGTDPRVPLSALLAAAGSGPNPGQPGLTMPYQLDGQWYAALVAAPDPRGTPTAIIALAGLHMRIDDYARAAGVEALIISAGRRVWWTVPLDSGALNLPVESAEFGEPHDGADRISAWRGDTPEVARTLQDFGLTVHVRASRSDGWEALSGLDYSGLVMILLTGLAGLIAWGLASRSARSDDAVDFVFRSTRPIPGARSAPADATAFKPFGATAQPSSPPTPRVPFIAYAVRPDESGTPEVWLTSHSQLDMFGLDGETTRLPAAQFLHHIADQQRPDLEAFLDARGEPREAPIWLDWDIGSGHSTVLLHLAGALVSEGGMRGGLLAPAEELHDLWQSLEATAAASGAANIRKSQFLARLSHELRTPLNAIIGFAELMENETLGPVGTPRYKDYLGDISASGRHLHDLINDIIDISRVETGELDLSESILPIRSELEACVRFIRERVDASNLEFVFDVPDGLPKLRADPLRFRQIMLNLLSNAIKYTRPGGEIGLTARITADGTLRIAVVDTGIGMDEAGLRRALEPFGRISDDQYSTTESTGLGLPIARGLVALHGGRLEIDSAPGAGTTVNVIFPESRLVPAD